MAALSGFALFAIVNALITSTFGVNGSVRHDSGVGVLTSHLASIAGLCLWLFALRFANWRYKLLVRLPESFAGTLLEAIGRPFLLVDQDNVILFANIDAEAVFRDPRSGGASLTGLFFHDLFDVPTPLLESSRRLKRKLSEQESCVAVAKSSTTGASMTDD